MNKCADPAEMEAKIEPYSLGGGVYMWLTLL